jgi:cell wall-associated NlpC family hydrolase
MAVGALAAGGLLIYAAITDQPLADALRNLVKGTALKPAAFVKPISNSASGSGVNIGSGPLASLASAASKYLGVPYRWGGSDSSGMDCSGLVWRSFRDIGITAPRVSSAQLAWSQVRKIGRADVSAGDLVGHLGVPGHIGVAISNSEAIFAPHTGTVVQVQSIDRVILRSVGIYVRYVGSLGGVSGVGGGGTRI